MAFSLYIKSYSREAITGYAIPFPEKTQPLALDSPGIKTDQLIFSGTEKQTSIT